MSDSKPTLESRVQRAILQEAIFRPESALVISLTLLLAMFAPQVDFLSFIPAWAWLVGGALAETGLVYSSLSDARFGQKVVAKMLRNEFEPQKLKNSQLQRQIEEAFDYRARIQAAIQQQPEGLLKDELKQTAVQIDEWLEHIYNLARRIDRYYQDRDVLLRDHKRTDKRIQELNQRLKLEKDPQVRQQIEVTRDALTRQHETLETLGHTISRAELQLENSHAHLATIYSQTMLIGAKDIDSSSARRLRQEIDDEVNELQDVLVAMDEVYASNSSLSS